MCQKRTCINAARNILITKVHKMIFGSELLLFVTILRAFPADLRIILSIFVATDVYTLLNIYFEIKTFILGPYTQLPPCFVKFTADKNNDPTAKTKTKTENNLEPCRRKRNQICVI